MPNLVGSPGIRVRESVLRPIRSPGFAVAKVAVAISGLEPR